MELLNKNQRIALPGEDDVDLSAYLAIVREKWRAIAALTLAGACIGAAYVFVARPVYRADAMFQIEESMGSEQSLLGNLASVFDTKQTAASEIEVIKSRLVVDQAVRKLHLDISAQPRYFPVIGSVIARHMRADELAAPLFGLSRFAAGGEAISVSQFDIPREDYDEHYVLIARAEDTYDLLDPHGTVLLHGKTGVLEHSNTVDICVEKLVARPGTEFKLSRASMLKTTEALQKALSIDEKSKQADIIRLSLDGTDAKLTSETVNAIAQAYLQQNIDRKSADAAQALDFLNHQLPQLRQELEKAETRYNEFRNRKGTADLAEESRLLLQQVVDNKAKAVELQQRRLELSQRFAPTHPAVVSLDTQIAALQAQQESLNKGIASLPDTEQSALRLLRDVRVDTELYTNLLDSAQQLRMTKAGQIGSVRLVDVSVTPETPIAPKVPLVLALATLLGLMGGTAFAFVRRAILGGMESSDAIEGTLGVPVFAVVPRSIQQRRIDRHRKSGKSAGLSILATAAPDDIAIEAIRVLRTALKFGLGDSTNNIIALTGARPAAGKSFVALNLASVLASEGRRILLIDADMRRGTVDQALGIAQSPGLSDAINGHDLNRAIVREVTAGVDVLPRGSNNANPSELLSRDRFEQLLDTCSKAYDFVIVDTPPVLAVTDPVLICKHAGIALLVLRFGQSPAGEVLDAASRLRHGGVTIKGALLNGMPHQRSQYGASYYSSLEPRRRIQKITQIKA